MTSRRRLGPSSLTPTSVTGYGAESADWLSGLAQRTGSQPGSADALGERDDDAFRPPDVGHPPNALVLTDAADQPVALGCCPIDSRLQVVDLEGDVAQSQLVRHGSR